MVTAMITTSSENLPWQPIFTIERSRKAEVTVYGIVSVVTGDDNFADFARPLEQRYRALVSHGKTDFELWTRSLLKPWQLLSHMDTLKRNYPDLKDEHYALFMASHSAEPCHMEALETVMKLTGINEESLRCPQAAPLCQESKDLMKSRGEKPRRRYHNCSGKHSGYLAALKAMGQKPESYLDENNPHHDDLKEILAYFTGRPTSSFVATTDGCQLPNYALSTFEIAGIYQSLFNLENKTLAKPEWSHWGKLGQLMHTYPRYVSGLGRLDYKIMTGEAFPGADFQAIAKEGADGLLGVSIISNKFPNGLGICIKLSSGFDNKHMELILREILQQLELAPPKKKEAQDVRVDHIKTHFHFQTNATCSGTKALPLSTTVS